MSSPIASCSNGASRSSSGFVRSCAARCRAAAARWTTSSRSVGRKDAARQARMSAAPESVLDASALVALLWDEPGASAVEPLLGTSVISALSWAEVLQRFVELGEDDRSMVLL